MNKKMIKKVGGIKNNKKEHKMTALEKNKPMKKNNTYAKISIRQTR